jgi:hypothetical protein
MSAKHGSVLRDVKKQPTSRSEQKLTPAAGSTGPERRAKPSYLKQACKSRAKAQSPADRFAARFVDFAACEHHMDSPHLRRLSPSNRFLNYPKEPVRSSEKRKRR